MFEVFQKGHQFESNYNNYTELDYLKTRTMCYCDKEIDIPNIAGVFQLFSAYVCMCISIFNQSITFPLV